MSSGTLDPGSFRDPAGCVFEKDGTLYRQINAGFDADYRQLIESGLYDTLVTKKLLVAHTEADLAEALTPAAAAVLEPERVPFISFPYEWSFHQLQAAAITTLEIAEIALDHGMVLKDASAYNVQFVGTRPVFIDTLSFENYQKGEPWVAYRQFCQHFLAPLALMSYVEPTLNQLLQSSIDGVPLPTARAILPRRAFFKPSLFTHLYLHAKSVAHYADAANTDDVDLTAQQATDARIKKGSVSEIGLRGLIDSLKGAVRGLPWKDPKTEWGDYYDATNYDSDAMSAKADSVKAYLEKLKIQSDSKRVFDLGANTGQFSQIAADLGFYTIAADIDPVAVDRNFRNQSEQQRDNLLPLRIDLSAPSPAIGWNNTERPAFFQRFERDTVMALALIHHLAVGNNTPLPQIAQMFAEIAGHLIIEFVPKEDSQVQRLLATREDIFPHYISEGFETAFGKHFDIIEKTRIQNSSRDLYLLKRR